MFLHDASERLLRAVLVVAQPAYHSLTSLNAFDRASAPPPPPRAEDWLLYWMALFVFTLSVEPLSDFVFGTWLPLYRELKLAWIVLGLRPDTGGAAHGLRRLEPGLRALVHASPSDAQALAAELAAGLRRAAAWCGAAESAAVAIEEEVDVVEQEERPGRTKHE
jgi:hypothetical protein